MAGPTLPLPLSEPHPHLLPTSPGHTLPWCGPRPVADLSLGWVTCQTNHVALLVSVPSQEGVLISPQWVWGPRQGLCDNLAASTATSLHRRGEGVSWGQEGSAGRREGKPGYPSHGHPGALLGCPKRGLQQSCPSPPPHRPWSRLAHETAALVLVLQDTLQSPSSPRRGPCSHLESQLTKPVFPKRHHLFPQHPWLPENNVPTLSWQCLPLTVADAANPWLCIPASLASLAGAQPGHKVAPQNAPYPSPSSGSLPPAPFLGHRHWPREAQGPSRPAETACSSLLPYPSPWTEGETVVPTAAANHCVLKNCWKLGNLPENNFLKGSFYVECKI